MCIGGSPKAPAPPPRTPEAPTTPDVSRRRDTDDERRRRAAGGEGVGTILTGARGVTDGAATASKTLLGQ